MTRLYRISFLYPTFILLLLAISPAHVLACDLTLHVNGSTSVFEIEGTGESSVISNIQLEQEHTNQRIGLLGSFVFSIPGGCPASNRQLQRSLQTQSFALESQDLHLYPNNISLQAGGIANLQFLNFRFDFLMRRLAADEDTNTISSSTTFRVLQGNVSYTVAPTLGLGIAPGLIALTGQQSKQAQEAEILIQDSQLRLHIPKTTYQFSTVFETGVELVPNIFVVLNFTGEIFAEAFVDCSDVDCGEHGRCLALDSGESVCQCSCGWIGEFCQIPSGFCAEYGPLSFQSTTNLQQTAQTEDALPNDTDLVDLESECQAYLESQTCSDSRKEYDYRSQGCKCVDGWQGTDCDLCKSNAGCLAFYNEEAACAVGGIYETYSGLKVYQCDLEGTGFDAFIGDSLRFLCNTTGPRFFDTDFQNQIREDPSSVDVVGNTPFCDVHFVYRQETPVNCKAWGCEFKAGSSKARCSEMLCDCEDCEQVRSIIDNINSVQLECDHDEQCEVKFGGLSLTFKAPCMVRECLLPSNSDFSSFRGRGNGFDVNWDIFTISLPIVILLALSLFLGFPTWTLYTQMRKKQLTNYERTSQKKTLSEIAEIRFHDVSCSVPVQLHSMGTWTERLFFVSQRKTPLLDAQTNLPGLKSELHQRTMDRPGFKSVLHGVSGSFRQGQLVGIMGPSGSGKTTFLSIICSVSIDNLQQRQVGGEILVNGTKTGRWMKRLVAFVPQDDKLLSTLTVRECLLYSAILRKPQCSMMNIHEKVDGAIQELGLTAVEHSFVGGSRNHRGISGGEKRRVTIGMELVIDPSLVILDEPTSGLDSFTALNLVQNLKNVCARGRTVILSVHQPAPAMFDLLDQILLLSRGFQVYLGHPEDARNYFAQHGCACPDKIHVAEYMLQTVSHPDTLVPLLNSIHDDQLPPPVSDHQKSKSAANTNGGVDGVMYGKELKCMPRQNPFLMIQVLLWRGYVDIVRNPALLLAHVIIAVVIGCFSGFIFFDVDLDIDGAQNRLGGAFFVLAFLGFWSLTIIDLLHVERMIILRETSAGYYNVYLYLFSKILLDAVLLRVIPSILLSLPIYFLMGLQCTVEKFFIFIFTVSTFNVTIGALSMAVTLLAPTAGTASLVINTLLLIGLLFAGHLVNVPSMHKAVRWVHYLSPFHYGFQVLAVNEMLGLRLRFDVPGVASVDGIGGDIFLRTIGIEHKGIASDLRALVITYAIALVITFAALWYSRRHFRGPKLSSFSNKSIAKP